MIDVKQTAQSANNFISGLYPNEAISNVMLEEVEMSEDGKYWLITLSFPLPSSPANLLFNYKGRQYKIFKVDANSGEVLSMKIREIQNAAA